MASALLDYFTLYPNLHSLWTPLYNLILGLQLKGDIANSFTKAHTLYRPPLVRVILSIWHVPNSNQLERHIS